MYTLKIESSNKDFLRMVQAFIQENKLWTYKIIVGPYYPDFNMTMALSTPSIRELKRLVDLLESEEFMRE